MLSTQGKRPPALAILGATGTGKTELAVQLVEKYPFQIISVDSALVYKEMNIGTAKPNDKILNAAPHRLINLISPEQVYSAADFRLDALREMQSITSAGEIPLLVGGTGLYFRALFEGLSELPAADRAIRLEIEKQAKTLGWNGMHQRLAEIDPLSASRIHPNDPQRISRALEVYKITGQTLSSLLAKPQSQPHPYEVTRFILEPEKREWLRERLAERFMQMLDQGLVNETRQILEKYTLDSQSPSMRLVGYRQVYQYLRDELTYKQMIDRAINATRQLAKRQMTWFRADKTAKRFFVDKGSPFNKILHLLNKV